MTIEYVDAPATPLTDATEMGIPSRQPSSTVEDERHRRKVALVGGYRILSQFGLDEGISGHITARDPEDPHRFWTGRWGRNFGSMTMDDLILVDRTGAIVEGSGHLNLAAFAIHSAIHDARPDVIGAVHSHGLHGKSYASLRRMLAPLTQDACAFYGDHVLYDKYEGVVLAEEEGRGIAAELGPRKAVILANHGTLTVGTTVESAVWWFLAFERSIQAELLARAAGTVVELDHDTAALTAKQTGNEQVGWFAYHAVIQKVLRTQDDFRELWGAGI